MSSATFVGDTQIIFSASSQFNQQTFHVELAWLQRCKIAWLTRRIANMSAHCLSTTQEPALPPAQRTHIIAPSSDNVCIANRLHLMEELFGAGARKLALTQLANIFTIRRCNPGIYRFLTF